MSSLEKKCYLLEEENMILKDDINHLRKIIENLKKDKCEMKVELKMMKSDSMEFKYLSEDGEEAVEELLKILNEDDNYTYISRRNGSYYRIYTKDGRYIFVIENYDQGRASKGLLTTPELSHILLVDKSKYEKMTRGWLNYGRTTDRQKYDFRGKRLSEVMEILNEFI